MTPSSRDRNKWVAIALIVLTLTGWAQWLIRSHAPVAPSERAPQSEAAPAPAPVPRAPRVDLDQDEWTAYEGGVAVAGRVLSALDVREFNIDYGPAPDLGADIKRLRRSHPQFTTELLSPGDYVVRARVITTDGQTSAWSDLVPVRVRRHSRPTAPKVFGVPEQAFVGQVLLVNTESKTVRVRIRVTDEQGQTIYVGHNKEDVFVPPKAGRYTVRAVAVNKDGQESVESAAISFEANLIPSAIAEPKSNTPDQLDQLLVRAPTPLKPNEKFRGDLVSVEALLWQLQSSQQYYQNAQRSASVGVGVRGVHWFGTHGIEGIFRTDLFGANEAGQSSQIMNVEVHYHRRWFMTSPFTTARQMQMTIYAGVERFRNARSDLYSAGYDLFKLGATAAVPFSSRWSVSGEGGLGVDPHGSRKYELQGLLTYYWSREWSFGLGYRTNLFEARTAAQAPGGFYPYREGYTEFRSVFNYQF